MAVVLDFFIERYLDKLSDFIEGEIGKVIGVEEELKKIHDKLLRISPYIQDAEKKRRRNPVIDSWVKELKDIMYDAEDILDICLIEDGRLLAAHPCSCSGVHSPISLLASCFQRCKFRRDIWNKIKKVNDRLEAIKEVNNLVPGGLVAVRNNSVRTLSTTSPTFVATDIVGTQIEEAAQNLISKMEHSKKNCSVFGISGMGGMGKTTLAKKIFDNDEMVKKQFKKQVWLHVSKDYSQIDMLKQVLRGIGGNDDGVQSRAEIEGRIVRLLSESLLLVLDDIWSTNVWMDLLRNVILNGSGRSVILFTTRHENVARAMNANFVHRVEKMHEDNGWELIRKIIFGDDEDVIISELKEVGMEIVRKCDGLPLAVKVMAGVLLHKERTKREWGKVVESDLWSTEESGAKLSNALYLSYEDLPSHLKQCFLSCAFYRGISSREEIIRLWMGEGFVIEQSENLMENIAEDYYRELIARNLLQITQGFTDDSQFIMHDVLRSFGQKLMEEEGIIINAAQCKNTNSLTKIRHLSISTQGDVLSLPNVIIEQKCLRALHLFKKGSPVHETPTMWDLRNDPVIAKLNPFDYPQINRIENHAFESLKCLRVLHLCDTSIDSLPNSVMKLLHLKYLGLDRTKIRRLPEFIECLTNLQTLNLSGCESLHELPKGITRLRNLRCLRIDNTPLTHVPMGVGKLKNLNHLSGFLLGHCDSMNRMDGGCDLDELQYLCNLIYLFIDKLEMATTRGNRNFVLENKTFLRRFFLKWTRNNNENNEEQSTEAERISNQLSPPRTLEELGIANFPGQQFPAWMVSTSIHDSLADLTILSLCNFPSCVVLPPLGQLPNLKYLLIEGGKAIKNIGPEFLGCRTPAFPKLDYLAFNNMPNWEAWVLSVAHDEPNEDVHATNLNLFPNLEKCFLIYCPKLKNSILPPTRFLQIDFCPNLKYVKIKVGMLQKLEVLLPPEIQQLPQWVSSLINATLHTLQIFFMECDSLLLDSCSKGKQNWHIIQQIPKVTMYSIDRERRLLLSKGSYKYEIKDEFGSFITLDQPSFNG